MSTAIPSRGTAIEYQQEPGVWLHGEVIDLTLELPERETAGQAYRTHSGSPFDIHGGGVPRVNVKVTLPDGREALRLGCAIGDGDGMVRLAAG